MIDDPASPEGQAITEYINSHHLLPPNYQDTTGEEIIKQGERLFDAATTIAEKKKIGRLKNGDCGLETAD